MSAVKQRSTVDLTRELVDAAGQLERVSGSLEERYRNLRRRLASVAARWQESRQHLEQARAEKERLSRLLDGVLESIDAGVILRGPGGQVLAANGAAWSLGAVVVDGESTLLHDALAAIPEGAVDHDVEVPGAAGPATWEVRVRRVALPELGSAQLWVVRDVTRRVELEAVTRRRSSLEALGRMAAEVAHEVRNPLGSLELCASMLVDDLEKLPEDRELAEQILIGVRQLSATVTRLLGSVRSGGRRPRRSCLATLTREVCEFVQPVARCRGIALDLQRVEGRAIEMNVDVEGMRQVLLNLLGNALDISPEGGRITLAIHRETDGAVISVMDEGPGVPAEERERIFEPFYTTRAEGNGIGLAVAERIVLAHDGRIRVTDAPGGGACFRIELPGTGGVVPREEKRS